MSDVSKQELEAANERKDKRLAKMKQAGERLIIRGASVLAGNAAGYASGQVAARRRTVTEDSEVKTNYVLGLVLTGAGMADLGGKYSDLLLAAGIGFGAGESAVMGYEDGMASVQKAAA